MLPAWIDPPRLRNAVACGMVVPVIAPQPVPPVDPDLVHTLVHLEGDRLDRLAEVADTIRDWHGGPTPAERP